jgi:hypothetical protein
MTRRPFEGSNPFGRRNQAIICGLSSRDAKGEVKWIAIFATEYLGNCFGSWVWERLGKVISEILPLDQLVSGSHSRHLYSTHHNHIEDHPVSLCCQAVLNARKV